MISAPTKKLKNVEFARAKVRVRALYINARGVMLMDYRVFAIEALGKLNQLYVAERNIKSRISEIDTVLRSVGGGGDGMPGGSGDNKTEHKWLSLIASKDDEKARLRGVCREIKRIADALSVLTQVEEKVLRELYVVGRNAVEFAAAEYTSRSTVYRLRDEAMVKFTRALFGVVVT